jgi:two-component system sensor histidine kinase BarA
MEKSKTPSLLIVEDNFEQQEVLRGLCEKLGFVAYFVSCGEESIGALRACTTCFDAILMEWKMDGIDGGECTRRIRELETPTNRHTPIIAISTHPMEGDRKGSIDAGMDDYLSKPITFNELRRTLLRWTYNAARPNLRLLPVYDANQTGSVLI